MTRELLKFFTETFTEATNTLSFKLECNADLLLPAA